MMRKHYDAIRPFNEDVENHVLKFLRQEVPGLELEGRLQGIQRLAGPGSQKRGVPDPHRALLCFAAIPAEEAWTLIRASGKRGAIIRPSFRANPRAKEEFDATHDVNWFSPNDVKGKGFDTPQKIFAETSGLAGFEGVVHKAVSGGDGRFGIVVAKQHWDTVQKALYPGGKEIPGYSGT